LLPDNPSIPFDEFEKIIKSSQLLELAHERRESKAYVFKKNTRSNKPIILRNIGDYPYDYAIYVASRAKVLSNLMRWFEENRNYKDGGYFK
jgi:hypothetical protein